MADAEDRANVLAYAEPEKRPAELRTVLVAAITGAVFLTAGLVGFVSRNGAAAWGVIWAAAGLAGGVQWWAAREHRRGRTTLERVLATIAATTLVLGAVLGGVAAGRVQTFRRPGHPTWMTCYSGSRQVAVALSSYAKEHGGRFPDQLDDLVAGSRPYVRPDAVARLGEATRPTTRSAAPATSGPLPYWYLGAGETTSSPPGTVILVEQCWRHPAGTLHAVTADGRVEMLKGPDAAAVLRQVSQRTRPVMWPMPKAATTRPLPKDGAGGSNRSN